MKKFLLAILTLGTISTPEICNASQLVKVLGASLLAGGGGGRLLSHAFKATCKQHGPNELAIVLALAAGIALPVVTSEIATSEEIQTYSDKSKEKRYLVGVTAIITTIMLIFPMMLRSNGSADGILALGSIIGTGVCAWPYLFEQRQSKA